MKTETTPEERRKQLLAKREEIAKKRNLLDEDLSLLSQINRKLGVPS